MDAVVEDAEGVVGSGAFDGAEDCVYRLLVGVVEEWDLEFELVVVLVVLVVAAASPVVE